MRRQGSVRGPVRRTVLTAAIGLLSAGIAGCGLRLDRDPQLPALSPVDVLRDAVARSLAAVQTDASASAGGDTRTDDGIADAIHVFAEAVGPPWEPPADLAEPAAPPNPDPSPMAPIESLTDVARRIVLAARGLDTGSGPTFVVLADVAVGALLRVDSVDTDAAGAIRADLRDAVREVLGGSGSVEGQAEEQAGGGSDSDDASGSDRGEGVDGEANDAEDASRAAADARDRPLAALITACYAGVYAYERGSVQLPVDDPARQSAHVRIGQLHAITAVAATLGDVDVPSNRPAWDLPVVPHDAASAREALRIAEDGLVEALATAQDVVPPIALLSWLDDSGRARRRAEGAQDLRFTVVPGSHEEDG